MFSVSSFCFGLSFGRRNEESTSWGSRTNQLDFAGAQRHAPACSKRGLGFKRKKIIDNFSHEIALFSFIFEF
jgi:hypothetical protein